jgi:heptosyltransferase-2
VTKVGILKPDHLGDMVLAVPAIAALRRRFADSELFCQPRTQPLAEHLFPALRCRAITFPHLDKERRLPREYNPVLALRGEVDLLVSLRWDATMGRLLEESEIEHLASGEECFETHVTIEHRRVVQQLTGPYDLLHSYSYEGRASDPSAIQMVGLCISAGFPLNAWPLNHWLQLGERLHERGFRISLIGGPAESARLRVLGDALGGAIGYAPVCVVGGSDFGIFLRRVAAAADLVVATDSGTAHLAALVRPVISLFGGTPWRRYAPLGHGNLVISRREACSPCRQFDRTSISSCTTQECLVNLFPNDVLQCLERYLAEELPPGMMREGRVWMLRAPWEDRVTSRDPRPRDAVCLS